MFVDSSFTRCGVGSALIQELIREAEQQLFLEQLHLRVTHGNKSAISLYQRAGFQPGGIEVRATKIEEPYYDAIHMHLQLHLDLKPASTSV